MRLAALCNLVRLHTAQWEAVTFLFGLLLIGHPVFSATGALLVLLGVLINSYIFVLNDVADLPRDRHHPGRAASPLVAGTVSVDVAISLSVALPIVMWILIAIADWPARAEVAFASMVLLGAYVDVWQKTSPRVPPPVMDLLFGVTMAAPIPVVIWAVGSTITNTAWLVTVGFFVLMVQLNSVAGNLKDLAEDERSGARTTAIVLGSTVADGRLELGASYRRWIVTTAVLAAPWYPAAAISTGKGVAALGVAVALVALWAYGTWSLATLLRGRREPSSRGREPFVYAGMAATVLVIALDADLIELATILGVAGAIELGWARRSARPEEVRVRSDVRRSG